MKNEAKAERKSDREYVVSRVIDAPADVVFKAWAQPELFKQWWIPEGAPMKLVSCDIDARVGGKYRLVLDVGSQNMDFFGKYLEVVPGSRLVWTNEEGGEGAATITSVTYEKSGDATLVTVHDLYPSKAELDEAVANGSTQGMQVQLAQLNAFVSKH